MPYNAKMVFDAFVDLDRQHGRPPTIRELLDELDWLFKSTSTIKYHLDNLVILGMLKREEGKSRNYALIEDLDVGITRDASGVIEIARNIAYKGDMTMEDMLKLRTELARMGIDYSRATGER